jgi:hypothetical protein
LTAPEKPRPPATSFLEILAYTVGILGAIALLAYVAYLLGGGLFSGR